VKIVIADKLPQEHSTEFRGLPVIIEWPKGSTRVGKNPDGTTFKTEMKVDYGYIPDTTAAGDKEKLDIYRGTDEDAEYAYIVEQLDENGEFDEYKIMLGFSTLEEAEEAYVSQAGEDLLGDISEVDFEYLFDTVKEKQKEATEKKEAAKMAGWTRKTQGTWSMKAPVFAGEKYTVIEAFLKNYKHEVDFYDEVAHLVQDKLDQALQDAGIKAVVSSRAKTPDRLRKKLYKRDLKRHYQTFRDIDDDIIDLAGCRVALYMPADRDAVGQIIEKLFVPVRSPKSFPESSKPEEGDTLGYTATHYLVRLRPETLRKKELRYADTQIEIQVASVLMHAWAEVTHDLLYKPEKGQLTPEEHETLSNLNRLVQEGERELEKLQFAIEGRTDESLRFEIAAALATSLKARSMGKTASLTVGDIEKAVKAIVGSKKSLWSIYVHATETLRKARWERPDDEKYRKAWESAGVSGNETHYVQKAMEKLAPGKPISTLWVLPNRTEIIALAQQLKDEAKKEI
jgi:ppGpp synthetase/RelA/SpoT-type nucleotidyltranferase